MTSFPVAVGISLFIAVPGYLKGSLSIDGAISGFLVGVIHFFISIPAGCVLFGFFISSSIFTKYKKSIKRKLEADYDASAKRTLIQVLINSFSADLAILYSFLYPDNDYLKWVIIGHYACCCGDTWASELGILSSGEPFHTIKFIRVPKGTNGAVSLIGIFASIVGGLFIGLIWSLSVFILSKDSDFDSYLLLHGMICGFLGSLIDSILGGSIQSSWYDKEERKIVSHSSENTYKISGYDILDNHGVNLVSSILTAVFSCYLSRNTIEKDIHSIDEF